MARVRLSETKDYELVHSDQDLRKQDLWDAQGHQLGTIDDMIVDTETERVVAVVLNNGDEYPAHDLSIGDDAVFVLNYDASVEPPPSVRRYQDEPLRRRATDGGGDAEARRRESEHRADRDVREREARDRDRHTYSDFTDDYRDHYDGEYGSLGRDFTDYEPAYRFGYDMAFETEYVGRDFDAAEEDLRRDYYRRMGYPMSDRHVWEDVRGAVRHAFERSREAERV